MKKTIIALLSFLSMAVLGNAQKIVPVEEMYIYGVAFNPVDSVVYITEMQPLQNVHLTKKTGFLYARNEYSNQLSEFMSSDGKLHMTVAVSYARDRKKAEKKYLKQKQKFQKGKYLIKYISLADFKFEPAAYDEQQQTEEVTPAKKDKKKKS